MEQSNLAESFVLVDREAKSKPPVPHPSVNAAHRPGGSPSFAHDWSKNSTGGKLRLHGRHFVDQYGRVCGLRGVNLSGSCKTPTNVNHKTFPNSPEAVTFVGRPFPLEEAHEHFSRLRRWGLTFLRFLVTWEAIEHEGLGIYDKEYLNYVRALLSLLPKYGLIAFVSLHQDVWSRYSGGSGAPAWTLKEAGFDLGALEETGAAWLLGVKGGGHTEDERGIWPCGYQKLAAATMATLFWAGDTFAPKLLVTSQDGSSVPIQQFLQDAFLGTWEALARAVGDLEGVLGFEMMNEPHRGYIEVPSLHKFDYNTDLHLSYVPSAFQSFMLGAGHPTSVPIWTRSFPMPTKLTSHAVLNEAGKSVWLPDGPSKGQCIWEMHGVWGWDRMKDEGVVLRENYFKKNPTSGEKVDWYTDFYFPFLKKWENSVKSLSSRDKLVFAEAIPNEYCPSSWTAEHQPENMVYAPHWYDLNALFAKAFGDFTVNVQGLSRGMFPLKAFYWGQKGARQNFFLQIRNVVDAAYKALGEKPVIIGECGIPMDMNKKEAFKRDNWIWQLRMMDALMTGLERSLIGFTLWNYNPSNDDVKGDDWNGENFSWYSKKRSLPASLLYFEQTSVSLDNGARILPAIVRPYPAKTAGIPIKFEYEMNSGTFTFEWRNPDNNAKDVGVASYSNPPLAGHPTLTSRETEIFIPSFITIGSKVIVKGLEASDSSFYDYERQTLFVVARSMEPGKRHRVTVELDPPIRAHFEVVDHWNEFGPRVLAFLVIVFGIIAYQLFAFVKKIAGSHGQLKAILKEQNLEVVQTFKFKPTYNAWNNQQSRMQFSLHSSAGPRNSHKTPKLFTAKLRELKGTSERISRIRAFKRRSGCTNKTLDETYRKTLKHQICDYVLSLPSGSP